MLNPSLDRCLAYRRRKVGLYAQEYENVGNSRIGVNEMTVPREIQAPVRSSAPLRKRLVPPFISRPSISLTFPSTATFPRLILTTTSRPALPQLSYIPPS